MEHYIELKANIHSLGGNRGVSSDVKTFFGSNWLLSVELIDNEKLKLSLHREANDNMNEAPVEAMAKVGLVNPDRKCEYNATTVRISNHYEWIYKKNLSELRKQRFIINDQITVRCEVRDLANEDRCISMIVDAPIVGEGTLEESEPKLIDGYLWHVKVAVKGNQQLKICISREDHPEIQNAPTYRDSIIRIGLIDVNGVFYTLQQVTKVIEFEWIYPGIIPDLRERGLIKGDWITVKCEFGLLQINKNEKNVEMSLCTTVDALVYGVGIKSDILLHGDHDWFLKGEIRGNDFGISITRKAYEGASPYEGPIDLGIVNHQDGEFLDERGTLTASEFIWTLPKTIEDLEQEGFIEDGLIKFRCEFERNEWPNNPFIPHGRS